MMRSKDFITLLLILLFGLGQTGCGSSQQPVHDHTQAEHDHHDDSDQSKATPSNAQTGKAIQDELNGLSTIEADINKGDFDSASNTFEKIHEEYHSAVLPPIKDKNAKLAEDMHSKFDALEDAIHSKDKDKTLNEIKTNKDSLKQAAKELGISIK